MFTQALHTHWHACSTAHSQERVSHSYWSEILTMWQHWSTDTHKRRHSQTDIGKASEVRCSDGIRFGLCRLPAVPVLSRPLVTLLHPPSGQRGWGSYTSADFVASTVSFPLTTLHSAGRERPKTWWMCVCSQSDFTLCTCWNRSCLHQYALQHILHFCAHSERRLLCNNATTFVTINVIGITSFLHRNISNRWSGQK